MNTRKEVASAAAEAGATIAEPMPAGLKPTRPNKSVPVAVRLSPHDVSAIEELASALDVSVSTLIRGWIRQGLAARAENTVGAALDQIAADVQRLRELVA